ncbi:269_t:CDS:2 [Diversispora eburnea]|uniref:Phosphotransferase n=1 Tax=Diversispora eburnea TaxID=1213867 RepID=A0A9N8VNE7_9GLOM|nr:269_t:CDS:2 [Diversispora eburnea]
MLKEENYNESKTSLETPKLLSIVDSFIESYQYGLTNDHSIMIPSYVSRLPTGKEMGTYFALDLGGTNLRVAAVTLLGDGKTSVEQRIYVIPDHLKMGTAEELFDWIASITQELLESLSSKVVNTNNDKMFMGVTFSFPIDQTAIDRGKVMRMGKGFKVIGLEGKDPVELLQQAYNRKGINIHISAIVNDSVGTLVANAYKDQNTIVSVIQGTGTNAACIVQIGSIKKKKFPPGFPEYMIINTEWSLVGADFLPFTKYDKLLDEQSDSPGFQPFEKMTSGMYLGELVRLVIVDYVENFGLFEGKLPEELGIKYNFKTTHMSDIESKDCTGTLKVLTKNFTFINNPSIEDAGIIKRIVQKFSRRSCQLQAAAIASLIKLQCPEFPEVEREIRVAIDGSIFHHYFKYSILVSKAMKDIQQIKEAKKIKLSGIFDGGCIGAAIIAMMYSR